jgi:hypothetical protein
MLRRQGWRRLLGRTGLKGLTHRFFRRPWPLLPLDVSLLVDD